MNMPMPKIPTRTIFCFIGSVVLIRSGSEIASMNVSELMLKTACAMAYCCSVAHCAKYLVRPKRHNLISFTLYTHDLEAVRSIIPGMAYT